MRSRMLTSHFILLPGGNIGKWPIIHLSPQGTVENVEVHPEGLRERPGLELHGGLLIPGLLDICHADQQIIPEPRYLNMHYAWGTIMMGTNNNQTSERLPLLTNANNHIAAPHNALNRCGNSHATPVLERIKKHLSITPTDNLLELLYLATEWSASAIHMSHQIGLLDEGRTPGVIVIQNLDLTTFSFTPQTRIKWLISPSIKF